MDVGPASMLVGNLVAGKRIAQAIGRELGVVEDQDLIRKVKFATQTLNHTMNLNWDQNLNNRPLCIIFISLYIIFAVDWTVRQKGDSIWSIYATTWLRMTQKWLTIIFFFIFTALIVFEVADDRGKLILMSPLKSLVVVLPLLCLGLGFSSVCGPPWW